MRPVLHPFAAAVTLFLAAGSVEGAEYLTTNPTQALPSPVYLTQPVEGAVEVRNLPPVQDVRIVGGRPEEPMEVRGEVGLRVGAPIPVEVTNPSQGSGRVTLSGPVKVDDSQPVRVWIDNSWSESAPTQEFAAFAFQGKFTGSAERQRRLFSTAPGRIFHLTELVLDGRPEASLRARLVVRAGALVGQITGADTGEAPVVVADLRQGGSGRLATAIPIAGDFAVDVEGIGQSPGSQFSAIAIGYLTRR
ncbi:MAG: hypothetical protein HY900_06825 [Deltaproteobacteria bacterium]|nr:hypothetical protein [Deltaproteobacteria bacterium]